MTPLESFYPRTDIDSPGVVLSEDRMTTLESFYPRTERLPLSAYITGQNDYPGVVASPDRMTLHGVVLFKDRNDSPWSRSILGQI